MHFSHLVRAYVARVLAGVLRLVANLSRAPLVATPATSLEALGFRLAISRLVVARGGNHLLVSIITNLIHRFRSIENCLTAYRLIMACVWVLGCFDHLTSPALTMTGSSHHRCAIGEAFLYLNVVLSCP